jgi:hypothetical protein
VPICVGSDERANTVLGSTALLSNTTGFSNVAVGGGALSANTEGAGNVAVGLLALAQNTVGRGSIALGLGALFANTDGVFNAAVGDNAMQSNTIGNSNVALGASSLRANVDGSENVALGVSALNRGAGTSRNVAVGAGALGNAAVGSENVALGYLAGLLTTGNNNILIGNVGAEDESATIRIGNQHNRAFIRGIRGITTANNNAVAVLIDSFGQLGTISSSRRAKQDIADMGVASAGLLRLRPVTFRYKQPYANGSTPLDYGLIAEEVAEVYPDLVARDEAGQIESVQYHKLTPMLLNELQRQSRLIEALEARLAALEQRRHRLR